MIQLLGDRVLVKQDKVEDKTKAGIIIPQTAQIKSTSGVVVAVGNGRVIGDITEPMLVKKGDNVSFFEGVGTEVTVNGEKLLLMREHDIYGINHPVPLSPTVN